ncbi:BRICHOS domain [Cinara cedri]|uniref:Integral membrane protein 2 n=1 Tax=Cinara cedri TaxID=506608 RepID=A0A5E4NKZ0_9HEMI|nr:BRICHOS domain [Cinara cedri]
MTVVNIPSITKKDCEQFTFNHAECQKKRKSICGYINHIILAIYMVILGIIIFKELMELLIVRNKFIKCNFEIKNDTHLNENYISHANSESEMVLSYLLDNNGTYNFQLNTTIKFVNYKEVARSSYLVPEVRIIHDFHGNLTSIINEKKRFCHIMPIIRTIFSPPESLSDLKIKVTSHYYAKEIEKFTRNSVLVKPSVDDLTAYGGHIPETCADYDIFIMMEKM